MFYITEESIWLFRNIPNVFMTDDIWYAIFVDYQSRICNCRHTYTSTHIYTHTHIHTHQIPIIANERKIYFAEMTNLTCDYVDFDANQSIRKSTKKMYIYLIFFGKLIQAMAAICHCDWVEWMEWDAPARSIPNLCASVRDCESFQCARMTVNWSFQFKTIIIQCSREKPHSRTVKKFPRRNHRSTIATLTKNFGNISKGNR